MHPVFFEIPLFGGIPIYGYGFMLGVSFIVGWQLTLWLAAKEGMDRQQVSNCLFWTIIGSLVGARLLFFMTNPELMHSPLDFFKLRSGGLVAYGGFIGGTLIVSAYCKYRIKTNFWLMVDTMSPGTALGLGLTRIGCFLYGCDFGKVADKLSWSVQFPKGSPAFKLHVDQHLLDPSAAASLPVHPTQLYSSLNGLLLFGLIMLSRKLPRKFHGQTFAILVSYYAITRFFIEMIRADTQRGTVGPLYTSQFIGIVLLLAALAWTFYSMKYRRLDRAYVKADAAPEPEGQPRKTSRKARKKKRKKR